MARILVAEDDRNAVKFLKAALEIGGFEVLAVPDGRAALAALDKEHFDALVTDVMMPGLDGFRLTEMLRESNIDIPILICTAKEAPVERRRGFLVGTDDYMVKPVDPVELVLRVKALLRRARIVADRRIAAGDAVLDYDALQVSRPGESVELPPKEFYLLYKLLAYPDRVFTRAQLMDEIWGMDAQSAPDTVNVHVMRLRKRFADWPQFDIVTVRGVGYKAVRNA